MQSERITARPRPLGTVNGFASGVFTLNGQRYRYLGTTLDLTLRAVAMGARVGDVIRTDMGLSYTLTSQGGGDRTPAGVWASREWSR